MATQEFINRKSRTKQLHPTESYYNTKCSNVGCGKELHREPKELKRWKKHYCCKECMGEEIRKESEEGTISLYVNNKKCKTDNFQTLAGLKELMNTMYNTKNVLGEEVFYLISMR